MTTRPWRASGAPSSKNWFTTVTTGADESQFETSQNTSRSSTIASAARLGRDSSPLRPMKKDAMQDCSQHQRFGVHYCHPTPIGGTPQFSDTPLGLLSRAVSLARLPLRPGRLRRRGSNSRSPRRWNRQLRQLRYRPWARHLRYRPWARQLRQLRYRP